LIKRREVSDIAIVTDSSACLPGYLVDKYGIQIVPMEFIYKGEVYRDEIDITPSVFYEILSEAKVLPTTSAPPPDTYLRVINETAKKADSILVVTPSKTLTHAFDSAKTAVSMARGKIPNVLLELLDCGTAAGAQGLIVLAAAKAAAAGKNFTEVIEGTRSLMPEVHLIAFLDTLYYLAKSGRVPQIASWASAMFKIKPFFELLPLGGEPKPINKVRTRPKAIEQLLQLFIKRTDGKPINCIVMHAHVLDEAEQLKSRIASALNCVVFVMHGGSRAP
jgi:DegV family protein with EDD domain